MDYTPSPTSSSVCVACIHFSLASWQSLHFISEEKPPVSRTGIAAVASSKAFAASAGYVWIVHQQSGICVDRSPSERDMCGSFTSRAGYVWIVRHQSGICVDCSPLFMFEAYQ